MSSPSKKVSAPVAVVGARALALALGCSAGVKATTRRAPPDRPGPTRASIGPITVGTAGATGGGGSAPNSSAPAARRAPAARAARARRRTPAMPVGRPLLQHDRQRLQGQQLDCGACPGDAHLQRRRDRRPASASAAPSCPAITCTSGGAREVLRQDRRRLRARARLRRRARAARSATAACACRRTARR